MPEFSAFKRLLTEGAAMVTSTENFLLQKFGPLLSLSQLADLLDRSVDGLRLSLSQDGEMSRKFNPARKKIGRRVYFRSSLIAPILDEPDGGE